MDQAGCLFLPDNVVMYFLFHIEHKDKLLTYLIAIVTFLAAKEQL